MISINYRDPRPIYEQIKQDFRRLILSGALKPNDKMPSVRELSVSLAINPNTVQRAYRELEAEGYTYSVPGKGNFVSADKQVDPQRVDALLQQMNEAVTELCFMGYTREELAQRILEGGVNK